MEKLQIGKILDSVSRILSKKRIRQEIEEEKLLVTFIDETSDSNPYLHNPHIRKSEYTNWAQTDGVTVLSGGFAHNEPAQQFVGEQLVDLLNLSAKSTVLEIGPGANYFIAQGMHEKGVTVDLLDFHSGDDEQSSTVYKKNPPKKLRNKRATLFTEYVGDIADVSDANSDIHLGEDHYDSITMNGSMMSGGNNFTLHSLVEAKYHSTRPTEVNLSAEIPDQIQQSLEDFFKLIKKLLNPGGSVLIGSSRFAFHGAGFSSSQLLDEKLYFLQLIAIAKTQGVRRIQVIGESSQSLENNLSQNFDDAEMNTTREKQAILEVFSSPSAGEIDIPFPADGGISHLKVSELRVQISNEQFRKQFLSLPENKALVDEKIAEYKDTARAVTKGLTQGVQALPDHLDFGYVSDTQIQKIKASTADVIPGNIGRIDSIVLHF